MKIALLTYSTRARGGVVHTLALAEALAARGHDVHVWTLARGGDGGFFRPVDEAVTLRLVPFADCEGEDVGARIVRSIAVLASAFEHDGYDIVHAQDCISANAVPGCVRTVHHLDTFTTPQLAECHERAIVEPQAHVCVSAAVATELRAGWGIEAAVIPNGVDAAAFADGAVDHRRRAAWRERLGRYVLAVGGIEPRKGSFELVGAMALVQRLEPDVTLVVAGGETLFDYRDYRDQVLTRAAELGVTHELLGPVPQHDLPALVAQAGAFAFPSVKEGFGLAAMEALAAGVPVVMSDLPVLHEVFGSTVRYAADESALAAELCAALRTSDPHRGAAGRELAGRHTWAAPAVAHEHFYERTVRLPTRRLATFRVDWAVTSAQSTDKWPVNGVGLPESDSDRRMCSVSENDTEKAGEGLSDQEMVDQVQEQTPAEEKYKDVFEREKDGASSDTEAAKEDADEVAGE